MARSVALPDADSITLNHGSTYVVTASVTDAAGNTSTDTANSLKIDIAPPDVPTVVSQITKDNTPTVTGNAFKVDPTNAGQYIKLEADDQILVVLGGVNYKLTVGSALTTPLAYNTATGIWTLNVPTTLADGTYNVQVSSTAGSVTKSDISSAELVIDTAPPATPVLAAATVTSVRGDTAATNLQTSNALTRDAQPVFSGTAEANSTLTVLDGGSLVTTVQVDAQGQWRWQPASALADGALEARFL